MEWMSTKEAAELWGVKVRQVQTLCEKGLVEGAAKKSDVWLLPKSATKPIDGRTKAAKLTMKKNVNTKNKKA
jgi:predicted site-specific integrase-resolvase